LTGKGFPVELGDQLNKVGINGFNGTAAFSANLSGRADGGMSGGGKLDINQARLVRPEGTLAEAIDAAVREASLVNLGIQYTHWVDKDDEFKLSTNLADLIANALKKAVAAYAKKALDEIERVLREKIAQYIDDKFVSKEEVDALFKMARGDKEGLDQLKNSLNNKKNEYEQKLKGAADQAVQQVKDDVKQQGQQAVQDVLQGKTPTIKAPSLPSGGGLKLPGR
jgi:multidrug efflux pump subunit AcrA (membrane-fusion protein)